MGHSPAPQASCASLAPSPRALALIHELCAEAVAIATAPGAIVLPAPEHLAHISSASDAGYHGAYFENGSSIYLFRQPGRGYWSGEEGRLDGEGRKWERRIKAVVDDFGNLVEIAR